MLLLSSEGAFEKLWENGRVVLECENSVKHVSLMLNVWALAALLIFTMLFLHFHTICLGLTEGWI